MTIAITLALTLTTWVSFYQSNYVPPSTSPKKGLASTFWAGIHPEDATLIGATWQYSWWPQMQIMETSGIEAVPMIDTPRGVNAIVSGDSKWLMGFNEPDVSGATFATPTLAAQLWHTIEISHADKLLVGPATVTDEGWLDKFRGEYSVTFGKQPRLDAIAVHCYRPTARDCIEWVRRFIDKARAWGIGQIWITEFSFTDEGELEKFVAWMESEPMISRYSVFVNRSAYGQWSAVALIDENGKLTSIGNKYAALP